MPRVKRGTHHVKRRKNILARTKGMMWGRKSQIKAAKAASMKAGANAYVSRKLKKRTNRGLQSIRINAAARQNGTTYSKLIGELKKKNIKLNRLMLSRLSREYPDVFQKIIKA
jgi:large subunit ribosomal protein L20